MTWNAAQDFNEIPLGGRGQRSYKIRRPVIPARGEA
jgi:hypothetical protein